MAAPKYSATLLYISAREHCGPWGQQENKLEENTLGSGKIHWGQVRVSGFSISCFSIRLTRFLTPGLESISFFARLTRSDELSG